ncbi:MAG: hypothetical protein F6K19_19965 [Cyanothece sp. SIO1E1]|nr:hypothetical protein [Cyanothece sp. SIO1E1]
MAIVILVGSSLICDRPLHQLRSLFSWLLLDDSGVWIPSQRWRSSFWWAAIAISLFFDMRSPSSSIAIALLFSSVLLDDSGVLIPSQRWRSLYQLPIYLQSTATS